MPFTDFHFLSLFTAPFYICISVLCPLLCLLTVSVSVFLLLCICLSKYTYLSLSLIVSSSVTSVSPSACQWKSLSFSFNVSLRFCVSHRIVSYYVSHCASLSLIVSPFVCQCELHLLVILYLFLWFCLCASHSLSFSHQVKTLATTHVSQKTGFVMEKE